MNWYLSVSVSLSFVIRITIVGTYSLYLIYMYRPARIIHLRVHLITFIILYDKVRYSLVQLGTYGVTWYGTVRPDKVGYRGVGEVE